MTPGMDYLNLLHQLDTGSWLRAAFAFLLCAVVLPLAMPLARRVGLVDHPGGRKDHDGAIPVIGGLVIFLALALSYIGFENSLSTQSMTFVACAGLMVLVGQIDDLYDLH